MLLNIETRYFQLKKNEKEKIIKDYLDVLYWINQKHVFKAKTDFEGEIKGIDAIGRLIIEQNGVLRYFSNKEVVFVR
jgi:BirA family biotin operon repressor/biotin-[acetyl-CoA-carboxylase] ligase